MEFHLFDILEKGNRVNTNRKQISDFLGQMVVWRLTVNSNEETFYIDIYCILIVVYLSEFIY